MLAKSFVLFVGLFQLASAAYWYKANDGNEYFIEASTNYNWLQAMDQCSRQGLQLVTIDHPSKNAALTTLLRSIFNSSPDLWIGHHDEFNTKSDKYRSWYTPYTGSSISFSYWGNHQPDNTNGGEHCAHIFRKADFKWNDGRCEAKFGFICERPHQSR